MKRLVLVAVGGPILAVVVLLARHYQRKQLHVRQEADWAVWQQRVVFAANVLDQTIELDGGNYTLQQLAGEITRQAAITVTLDEPNLHAAFHSSNPSFELPDGTLSLRTLFDYVLHDDVCADIQEAAIIITTPEKSHDRNTFRTAVYPLPQPEPRGLDEEDWAELIRNNMEDFRSRWIVGAADCIAVPGGLVVIETEHSHRQVRWLIDALSKLNSNEETLAWPPTTKNSRRAQIEAALAAPSQCNLVEVPLNESAQALSKRHRIPILLRTDKLQEAGISPQTPITKNLSGVSLQSALRLMVRDLELTYVVTDDAVLITTPEDAQQHLIVIGHEVYDLLDHHPDFPDDPAWDSFIDIILAFMRPDSWDDMSGPGPQLGYGDRWLVFSQTAEVHEQIRDLLQQMRRALAAPQEKEKFPLSRQEQAERKIEQALEQIVELDTQPRRLTEAIAELAQALGVPMMGNLKKLEEASVSPDSEVRTAIGRASGRGHLLAMLDPLELTYVIRDETLQITTPEDAESNITVRVYDVRELIEVGDSGEAIAQSVRANVEPTSWEFAGGRGQIEPYNGLMVVAHSTLVHRDVERYLRSLTKTRKALKQPRGDQ